MFKTVTLIIAVCLGTMAMQQDGAKKKGKKGPDPARFGATCPYSGGPAKKQMAANFGGGKVYFCCKDCLAKFNTMKARMNMQLFQTEQVKQVSCPMSGHDLKEGTEVAFGKTKVGFCCNDCKAKAEAMVKADADKAILTMFNGKMFTTGFKTKRQITQMKNKAKREADKKKEKAKADK